MSADGGLTPLGDTPSQFFVVRVMKTGSTTLVDQVRRNFPKAETYPAGGFDVRPGDIRAATSIPYLLSLPGERRSQIRVYMGHFPYIAYELLNLDCPTITILREPVARTISHLRHTKLQPRFRDHAVEEIYEDPFAAPFFFHNHQTKYFSMTRDDPLQGVMDVIDIDEHRLALAKATLAKVDVIGFTEQYDDFLEQLRRKFGWSLAPGIATNVGQEPWEPSAALRRRIEADNQADIELYAHAQRLRTQREASR